MLCDRRRAPEQSELYEAYLAPNRQSNLDIFGMSANVPIEVHSAGIRDLEEKLIEVKDERKVTQNCE